MSRFDVSRWTRILAWTGASLAWGAAIIAVGVEPPTIEPRTPAVAVAEESQRPATMPRETSTGLVILRQGRDPSVRTERAVAAPIPSSASPAPQSSGS